MKLKLAQLILAFGLIAAALSGVGYAIEWATQYFGS